MATAAVVGTGAWGTTLALLLARREAKVRLWTRTEAEATALRERGVNERHLPEISISSSIDVTSDFERAVSGAEVVFFVVPAQTMRANCARLKPQLPPDCLVVSAAKGLELDTGRRMSEVLAEELGVAWSGRICALSGPNLAREIARGLPASAVVASTVDHSAKTVQRYLMGPDFRVYTNYDVAGVELAGALKNIVALAAGISDGLGYGDNAKAGIMTRGLAEISRLGVAVGANPLTFSGLAGFGDLVATCTSRLSRNRFVGEQLGRGRRLSEIEGALNAVAEGVTTTAGALTLARRYGVEMPITEKLAEVLHDGKSPRDAVAELMGRTGKDELEGYHR